MPLPPPPKVMGDILESYDASEPNEEPAAAPVKTRRRRTRTAAAGAEATAAAVSAGKKSGTGTRKTAAKAKPAAEDVKTRPATAGGKVRGKAASPEAAADAPAAKAPAKKTRKSAAPKAKDAEEKTAAGQTAKAPSSPAIGFEPLGGHTAGHPAPASSLRRFRALPNTGNPRIFALDTNVLLHDPSSLFRFEEHDIFLPMTCLEELDRHKTGMSDIARNARQVSRTIEQLREAAGNPPLTEGLRLSALGDRGAAGRLFFQTSRIEPPEDFPEFLDEKSGDNAILAAVAGLAKREKGREVILVSKDINMRIKAATMGIPAEDYLNDKAIDDTDLLYTGKFDLPESFWDEHGSAMKSWQEGGFTWYRIRGPLVPQLFVNEFVHSTAEGGLQGIVHSIKGDEALIRTLRSFTSQKNNVWGITARNDEQNFALNLLMDPEIDFVTLLGQAGTGKTLLTLAAALTQTLDERRYNEIIFTRATVSVGEEIGFLPGTEEEKMTPWMGALEDNLEVLNNADPSSGAWGRETAADILKSRIRVKSMSFMRGRTFLNRFLIIDEAQNLSPKQMKTLITRAGPGTKIVCMGNIAQIDTPYLTEGSSGLTYVVDKFRGWRHSGHITLQHGERSRLADYAAEVL